MNNLLKKFLVFLGITTLCVYNAQAQLTVKGNVKDVSGENLPFVNIIFFNVNDTTNMVAGGITDMQGNYAIQSVKENKYNIVVSSVGYSTIKKMIQVSKNELQHNFVMNEDKNILDEVVVKGSRKSVYSDKSVYTFSKDQIKKARYSKDLLTDVEYLEVDMNTGKIAKMGGGNVQILINGINATDNDLKSIPADKVIKVEYYDIPPARFSSAQTLVNIITKKLDSGWNGGIDMYHAFTTGFANDNLYFNYIWGDNRLSFDYDLQYRNYNKYMVTNQYNYYIDKDSYEYKYHDKEKFGYTNNYINLKYTCNITDKHILQVIFSPNFSKNFSKGKGSKSLLMNEEMQRGENLYNNSIHTFGPNLDIYYSAKFNNDQELAANLVGTYYINKQKKDNREYTLPDNNLVLNDFMNQDNKKKSLIGELAYTKTWGKRALSLGYKAQLSSSDLVISNFLTNSQSYKYKSGSDVHYFYAEFANNSKILMYRLGIGGSYINSYNDDVRYSKVLFTPKFLLTYKMNGKNSLQWNIQTKPIIPSISYLNGNAVLITNELIHCGNPYLKSSINYRSNLKYNFTTPWLNLDLGFGGSYTKGFINTIYEKRVINGVNYIASTVENADSYLWWGGNYSLTFTPFKNNLLRIRLTGNLMNEQINSPTLGHYSHWYLPLHYNVMIRKGNFGGVFSSSIVSKQIAGSYLYKDENKADLGLFYKGKNWQVSAECMWIFTKSKYFNETLPNDILKHSQSTYIDDNRSMFVLGLSWNFSTKKDSNIDRKIQNSDRDTGVFY